MATTADAREDHAGAFTRRGRFPEAEQAVQANGSLRTPEVAPVDPAGPEEQPALAVFCYETPDSPVGQHLQRTAAALARRQRAVHVFSRQPFTSESPGVHVYPVGESSEGDLLDQVQEFTRRASNAFLEAFPAGKNQVTLMGCEWSAIPVVSVLCENKNAPCLLSLHSLERQRCDMTAPISQRIAEIELSGIRLARTILVQDPATAEVARHWTPECADRLVAARQPFPVQNFQKQLDPGAVKARYQVGPVDPMIVCLGDLDERYGPDLLIKALPAVLKNHSQVRLVIVGDGQLYWPLRVYSRYLLLEHAVRLVGHVEGQALNELLQAADIVAVPSRQATPWWPIQAAWAGRRPVMASHAAAPGLLEHEQDSVLVYPNENSCVWGLERLLYDAGLSRQLGDKGYAKLEERFGGGCVAAQIEELMSVQPSR